MNVLKKERDTENERHLQQNITVASGDWNSLSGLVETEWAQKEARSPAELLRSGQIAHSIGLASRSQELVRAAAMKANGDPHILIGCYSTATSAGWENDPEVHQWLVDAANASGENGPVQSVELKQLLELVPGNRDRSNRVWEALLAGTMPMFAAAKAMNRTLLDMCLVPALLNQSEIDPRKRSLVFSFSGARPPIELTAKSIALDVTAILTLAHLKLLSTTIDAFEAVIISHTTLGWLIEERQKLHFHQPSQVARARAIKRLIDTKAMSAFSGGAGSQEHEKELGDDIARFLCAAKVIDQTGQYSNSVIIRPYPLTRPGSLLDEVADTSGLETFFAGCSDVVTALRTAGRITAGEEEKAREYLSFQEKPWPHAPVIQPGATLYLDDVAVSYLQHVGILDKLKPAGFSAFISASEVERCDALIAHDLSSAEARRIVEEIRMTLADGLSSGKVCLRSLPMKEKENDLEQLSSHPTLSILSAPADAVVIDDRCVNQHLTVTEAGQNKVVATSFDVLTAIHVQGRITAAQFQECMTSLRGSGALFVPMVVGELLSLLNAAPVEDNAVKETAELRAGARIRFASSNDGSASAPSGSALAGFPYVGIDQCAPRSMDRRCQRRARRSAFKLVAGSSRY